MRSRRPSGRTRWPLWLQLLAPVLVASMLAMLLLAGLGEQAATRQAEQVSLQRATSVTGALQARATDLRRSKTVFADLLAGNADVATALASGDKVLAAQVLVPRRSRFDLGVVQAYGAGGTPLLELGESTGLDVSGPVGDALSGVATSQVRVADGGLVVLAVSPVKAASGIVGAVLVGRVLDDAALGGLAGQDGALLAVLRRGLVVAVSSAASGATVQAALARPSPGGAVELAGLRHLVSRIPIEADRAGQDLGELVALVPVQDLEAATSQRRRDTALLTAGLVALLAGTASLVARRVTRSLRQTIGLAQRMAGGAYDERLPSSSTGELDDLSSALNHLAGQVEERVVQLQHLAAHDALTGLPNRAWLEQRLVAHRGPAVGVRGVLFLDLDDFKDVNDSLGHAAGDELLVTVSRRLASELRAADSVVRLGGDEFAVLVEGAGDAAALMDLALRLQDAVQEPVPLQGRLVRVSASIGIAWSAGARIGPELLRDADAAMYAAKTAGKARIATFEAGMHAALLRRLELVEDLHRAVDAGELAVHFQPIVDLASGRAVAVEALLRWQHPRLGAIPPVTFIPLAEESGAIVAMGEWVLRRACEQVRAWQQQVAGAGALRLHVNVSVRQLLASDFAQTVVRALQDSGLDPSDLVLEITESIFADGPDVPRLLHELRRLGVSLAVDDFGTGYSSLSYLQDLPVDGIKIDRAFVSRLAAGNRNALVESVVAMAAALGAEAVAEGIETVEQLEVLQGLGCVLGQGFLMARPADASAVTELLLGPRLLAPAGSGGRPGSRPAPLVRAAQTP